MNLLADPSPRYLDERTGRMVSVETGIGRPPTWGTFWRSPHGGKRRVVSPAMPMTEDRDAAIAALVAYAAKHGWKEVR